MYVCHVAGMIKRRSWQRFIRTVVGSRILDHVILWLVIIGAPTNIFFPTFILIFDKNKCLNLYVLWIELLFSMLFLLISVTKFVIKKIKHFSIEF